MPAALAMAAAVQCVVSPGGSALVRATTRSITGWAGGGMRGGRVLSHSRPSTPACMKRSCQRQTTDLLLPVRRMIVAVPRPSAVSSTIRQRQTCFCGLLRSATTASRRARSAAFTVTMIPLRIPETRTPASPWESSKGLNCQVGSTSGLLKNAVLGPMLPMAGGRQAGARCGGSRRSRDFRHALRRSSMLQTDSSRCGQQFRDADEIVGGGGEDEEPFDQPAAAMTGLAQPGDGLDPAERLLDPLALDHADGIAGVARGAAVDGRAAVGIVLRDVRHAAALAAAGHEVGGVIVLVRADRAAGAGVVLDHIERRAALGRAVGFGQPDIDDEPMAGFRPGVAHNEERALPALAFAVQNGVRVRG